MACGDCCDNAAVLVFPWAYAFCAVFRSTADGNFSSSAEVFLSADGLTMLAIGTGVGAAFATLIFSMTLFGLPMLIDRDVDFMTAGLASIAQVMAYPVPYMIWGAVIGLALIAAIIPAFLRMFIVLPLFGHATWHLYKIQQISDHSRPQKSG